MRSAAGSSAIVVLIAAMSLGARPAYADTIPFTFTGNGFAGSGFLTTVLNVAPPDPNPLCGTAGNDPCRTDPPGAYAITGISGTFTSPDNNIFGAAITGLVPTNPTGERGPVFDALVPVSMSWYDDATGSLSYSNLYYPAGSPVVCADWDLYGSLLDVYGVAFTVEGGYTAVLWGDGIYEDAIGPTYGLKVTDGDRVIIDQFDGVSMSTVPEPATLTLVALGLGALGGFAARRRRLAAR